MNKIVLTDTIHLMIVYIIVSVVFYLSFWGSLARQSYDSAFDWKFCDKSKISFEKYKKSHNRFVAIMFIVFTVILIIKMFIG